MSRFAPKHSRGTPQIGGSGGGKNDCNDDDEYGTGKSLACMLTASEADEALALYLNTHDVDDVVAADGPWRSVVLRALSHGTDYDARSRRASGEGRRPGSGMRAVEAARFLAEALLRFVEKKGKRGTTTATMGVGGDGDDGGDEGGGGGGGVGERQNDDKVFSAIGDGSPQCVVADALWLVGCMLEQPGTGGSVTETTTTAEATARRKTPARENGAVSAASAAEAASERERDRSESFRALARMVSFLAFGSREEDADDDEEDKDGRGRRGGGATRRVDSVTLPPTVSIRTLRTSLEPSLLAAAGLLQGGRGPGVAAAMTKKLTRMNTHMHYRQTKFNLMQEESEGYAKLLTLLSGLPGGVVSTTDEAATGKATGDVVMTDATAATAEGGANPATPSSWTPEKAVKASSSSSSSFSSHATVEDDAVQRVRELIGAFDLDPNRVLDLTLDALEGEMRSLLRRAEDRAKLDGAAEPKPMCDLLGHAPSQASAVRALLRIVQSFRRESVPHLLGVKYASYSSRTVPSSGEKADKTKKQLSSPSAGAASPDVKPHKNRGPTPRSLHATAALLSLHGFLDVAALAPHLSPPAEELLEAYKSYQDEYGKRIRKMGTVSLNASASASASGSSPLPAVPEEKKSDDAPAAASAAVSTAGGAASGADASASPESAVLKGNKEEETENKEDVDDDDQILGLFDALIEAGSDWDCATALFGGTATHRSSMAAAACALREGTGRKVCSWISRAIGPACEGRVDGVGSEMLPRPRRLAAAGAAGGRARNGVGGGGSGNLGTPVGKSAMPGRSPGATPAASVTPASMAGTATVSAFSLLPYGAGWGAGNRREVEVRSDSILPDVVEVLACPLAAIGEVGSVRHDPILYCRLCRLVRALLQSQRPQSSGYDCEGGVDISQGTYNLLRTFLVPSLSMFPGNPALAAELWSVLSLLPYHIRYGLYGSWRGDGLEKAALRARAMGLGKPAGRRKALPNIESEVGTGITARWTLKRLSKDNIRDMGRQLAKSSHHNPLVVFTAILNQIESYDNLILMMVETFRYVTILSLDVIGYCLLMSLGGSDAGVGRSKLKADGVNAAQWLSSLETFTGAFYKKFPDVELRGILSYLLKRLRDGQVLELGVFRTLLKTAGGYGFADYESTASLSELQLEGRSGSLLLRRETSDFGIVEKTSRKAAARLRSVLQADDLGVAALLLLAQIRPRLLCGSGKMGKKEHIKLIGNLYDNCETVLGVLLDFLTDTSDDQIELGAALTSTTEGSYHGNNSALAKYARSLPTLGDLHDKYGVDPASAWMLCRPLTRAAMFAQESNAVNSKGDETDEKSLDFTSGAVCTATLPSYLVPFAPFSESSSSAFQKMVPEIVWRSISPGMYEAFYSLSLCDVHCPDLCYTTEINRLKKEADRLTTLKKGGIGAAATMSALAAAAAAAGGTVREIRQATAFTKEHQAELERVTRSAEALSADMKKQQAHCDAVRRGLEAKVKTFKRDMAEDSVSDDSFGQRSLTAGTFLTYCVYPRSLLSPEDALYCAHFALLLHRMETPAFCFLAYFDKLVNAIVGALYSTTEDEAGNLSLLLGEMWKTVQDWNYDENKFNEELGGKPGLVLLDVANENTGSLHSRFKKMYKRWHETLGDSLIGGLNSSEYMHIRASLIVLTRIVRVYPTRGVVGEDILKALLPLQEDNARQDIRAAAQGYSSQLIKARDDGVWREEDAAAAKARVEREMKLVEERRKNAEKQSEQMKEESERISRELGDVRSRWDAGRDRRSQPPRTVDPRGGIPEAKVNRSPLNPSAATFTPAAGGYPRELSRGVVGEPRDSRDHPLRDWERGRGERDAREYDRGPDAPTARRNLREREHHHVGYSDPPRSMKWERGERGRSEDRDRVGAGIPSQQPPPAPDARTSDRGRGDNRGSYNQADDRRLPLVGLGGARGAGVLPLSGINERAAASSGLEGRWVRVTPGAVHGVAHGERDGAMMKRAWSPEADREGGAPSGVDRVRENEQQSKRIRLDQPPPPRERTGPPPPRPVERGPLPHAVDARRMDARGRTSPYAGRGGPPQSERDSARRTDRRSRR